MTTDHAIDLEQGIDPETANGSIKDDFGRDIDVQPGMSLPNMNYDQRLFHYTYSIADEKSSFMSFRLLQRLNLVHLQNELAQLKINVWKNMSASPEDLVTLRRTMSEYVQAIRDFEYFQQLPVCDPAEGVGYRNDLTDAFDDLATDAADPYNTEYRYLEPFFKAARVDPLRDILRRRLPRSLAYSSEERDHNIVNYYKSKRPPTNVSPFVDRLARFIIAFASGTSLIVPMIIMSLNQSLTKSLITTSVAVVLLAAFLSFVIRSSNAETIVATAAYAAVLVVFIGVGS